MKVILLKTLSKLAYILTIRWGWVTGIGIFVADYLALKAFEGEDMSEHEGWKERRAALREEYRQLEQANLTIVTPQQ